MSGTCSLAVWKVSTRDRRLRSVHVLHAAVFADGQTLARGLEFLLAQVFALAGLQALGSGLVGSVFNQARRTGLLEFVDYGATSTDPGTHGKRINRWRVTPALRELAERRTAA